MGLQGFKDRPLSYKIAAVLVLCSGIFCAVGTASPYWYGNDNAYGGLWSSCKSDTGNCVSLTADVAQGWWLALQVLETLGLVCVTLSCSCLLFENCFHDVNAPPFLQESLGIVGGLLGAIGCFVFVGKTKGDPSPVYSSYSWAFYFAILGGTVIFIASVVILIGGKAVGKTLRTSQSSDVQVSPGPVRRFSHLWAQQSPSTPEVLRKPPPLPASSITSEDNTPGTPPTSPTIAA